MRVQERQQMLDQQNISAADLTQNWQLGAPARHKNSIPYKTKWKIRRDKAKETSQIQSWLHFFGGSCSNGDNVRAPLQIRTERQSKHLKS